MKECFLTPIRIPEPPPHTQIPVKCFTCKKFPVCKLREDYLKTALLMQRVLGDPQEDRELGWFDCKCGRLPGFKGYNFHKPENYFPSEITTTDEVEGKYLDAKWRNLDLAQFIYIIDGYYVQFDAIWNKRTKEFDLSTGKEVYYGIPYVLNDESYAEVAVGLECWREDMEEKEKENQHYDVINTTHFSAGLNCEFYEWEKGLSEQDGIKRVIQQYPHGVPCKDGTYYHLATFHYEPYKVPLYHPNNGQVAYAPMAYPVFVPKPCAPPPPKPERREDLDCGC